MKMIQLILVMAVLMGCHKSAITPEPDSPVKSEKVLNIEWATRIDPNRKIANGNTEITHYNDWLLLNGDLDDPATIIAFDKKTGDKSWEYVSEDDSNIEQSFLIGNKYIFSTGKKDFSFDLDSREILWTNNDFTNFFYEIDDKVLSIIYDGKYNIIKINPSTGNKELIYQADKSISPPVFTKIAGDDIMIFNSTEASSAPPTKKNQNLVAYNISKGEVLWEVEAFTNKNPTNISQPPIIHNDKVITAGDWTIYAFDVSTGKPLWKTKGAPNIWEYSTFNKTNHILHNGRLYVNEDGDYLSCINPDTGELLWTNADAANCTRHMIYYEKEDVLVYVSWGLGSIMVVDALTGETLQRERGYDNSTYYTDPVYDPELDMFFTSTFKHAVGFTVKRVE